MISDTTVTRGSALRWVCAVIEEEEEEDLF
jgi:hypothetical protein